MGKTKFPPVSFIIPTLNAILHLPRLINSIKSQDYPQKLIEILISDGGSTDGTIDYCRKNHLKVIKNPEVLHEPGKSLAAKFALGKIIFYTDSDNELSTQNWIKLMVKPYLDNHQTIGYLPQTISPPNSSSLNRYLGYLFTDPFTWFVYQNGANPKDYLKIYQPVIKNPGYLIFKFPPGNAPLFGLSQGVGTLNTFQRNSLSFSDDILAGLSIIQSGSLIAYIPKAGIYHYHVSNFSQFISKYTWRIRNNLNQNIKNMGFIHRKKYLSNSQWIRSYLFIPYSLSLILPLIDAFLLTIKYHDLVMLWHFPATITLAMIMIKESIQKYIFGSNTKLSQYE